MLGFICLVISVVLFTFATFDASIGDLRLIPAGLLFFALSFLLSGVGPVGPRWGRNNPN